MRSFFASPGSSSVHRFGRSKTVRSRCVESAAERACSAIWRAACERLEERRLFAAVGISGSVTLDESPGFQTSGVAVAGEDNNMRAGSTATRSRQYD
jgi:hypothetical protein